MVRFMIITLAGIFLLCSKSPEQRAESLLKAGNKRGAYILYQKSVKEAKGPIRKETRENYLSLTLDMAEERIIDEESMQSLVYYQDDFKNFADKTVAPAILERYAGFLSQWADSLFSKFQDANGALALLQEAEGYTLDPAQIQRRIQDFKIRKGAGELEKARECYAATLNQNDPYLMVEAEYHALCARKFTGDTKEITDLLAVVRKANLNTYAAYNRAMENGKTDPSIDRFDVYLAVTNRTKSGPKGITIEGSIYNLSPLGPIELNANQFALVDEGGKEYPASETSKFQKITLDTKMESKFTLVFPGTGNARVQKLVFGDGKRSSEKWVP